MRILILDYNISTYAGIVKEIFRFFLYFTTKTPASPGIISGALSFLPPDRGSP